MSIHGTITVGHLWQETETRAVDVQPLNEAADIQRRHH